MSLNLYNTLTNKKEPFVPIKKNKVSMYVCGVTVYDNCHLGHARAYVAFDLLARYLVHLGHEINFVRNITDIEDKIIDRANENSESIYSLTERNIKSMQEDFQNLGLLIPSSEPKATDYIDEMIVMIEALIQRDFAYVGNNGDVYFAVRQYEDYGKLSNRVLDELDPGSRVAKDDEKKDPLDFVLWKSSKPNEPFWESPWGQGRPGWHIECSAMSLAKLGSHFDIHGGGPDLIFPHHENEIAQSKCSSDQEFANYWIHSGLLKINGEKMSKSLGNFALLKDLLNEFHPEVIRYFLISSHYRSELGYDNDSLNQAKTALTRLYQAYSKASTSLDLEMEISAGIREKFDQAMNNDLNTPQAISVLFDLAKKINTSDNADTIPQDATDLVKLANILGLLEDSPDNFMQFGIDINDQLIAKKIEARNQARADKDFSKADQIRDELLADGIVLDDLEDGTTTWKKG
tara:strand:- start:5653 stop:7035 length:1383 start_codon:yes stop_codon:yes gene_type:complete